MNSIPDRSIHEIKKIIEQSKTICIVTHHNPDGDAIGSMLALFWYFSKKKIKVNAIAPNDFPNFLKWIPGSSNIILFDKNKDKVASLFNNADLIFCVDFNNLDRINDLGNIVHKASGIKILIDHHPNPDNFSEYTFSDTSLSSTSELIYEILKRLENKRITDKHITECIYTGIMTDTGSFSYNFSNPNTFKVTSELLRSDIDIDKIHDNVYDNFSEERMRLLGYCLNKKMVVIEEFNTAYISINREEQSEFNFILGDSEGFVNYPLSIKNIKFAAIFIEFSDHVKVSFRSKGEFQVNKFSRLHFNGGGHKNAAGGKSELSLEETIRKFVNLLPEYTSELN